MEKIKWVHFYMPGSKLTDTLHIEQMTFIKNDQAHNYSNAEEMLYKNTKETFNFWDGVPVGIGRS